MSSHSEMREHMLDEFLYESQVLTATIVLLEQAIAERLKISVTDLHCANLIRIMGPMTAGKIAELTGLTTGAITGMLDRLERIGFLRRQIDPLDRRRVHVHAEIEAMNEKVGPLYQRLGQRSVDMVSQYSDHEFAFLLAHMKRTNALTLDEAVKLRQPIQEEKAEKAGLQPSGESLIMPLEQARAGHLIFTAGPTRLNIVGDSAQEDLLRGQFSQLTPHIFSENGLVKIIYPNTLSNLSAASANVSLNTRIPWHIEALTNSAVFVADLRSVSLAALDVKTTSSAIDIMLPQPKGTVSLRISGTASTVIVRRSSEIAMQIRLRRGAANLTVDGQSFSEASHQPYQTDTYPLATDRYDIEFTGRFTSLAIEPFESLKEQ